MTRSSPSVPLRAAASLRPVSPPAESGVAIVGSRRPATPVARRRRSGASSALLGAALALIGSACSPPAEVASLPEGARAADPVGTYPVGSPAALRERSRPALGDPWTPHLANALWAPMVDDGDPPRWRDPTIWIGCDPTTRVLLDGAPLQEGDPLPPGTYRLTWKAVACRPFGPQGPMLDADLDLQVVPEPPGRWRFEVEARRLRWQSDAGTAWVRSGPLEVRMPVVGPTPGGWGQPGVVAARPPGPDATAALSATPAETRLAGKGIDRR